MTQLNYLRQNCLIILLLMPVFVVAQSSDLLDNQQKRLTGIFKDDQLKPTVLLLGVFHFAGEQVDANTTPQALRIDMASSQRQRQIEGLVKKLAAFKPTKIVIEGSPKQQAYFDSVYQSYCAGRPIVGRLKQTDEIVQIGFRLAKQFNLKTLYPVDAQAFRFKLSAQDSAVTFEKYKDQQDSSFAYWDEVYDKEKAFEDSVRYFLPLNKYLQYLNSPLKQAKAIGRWLIITKKGSNTEPIGADGFITRYFNRNVRIFSNIQRVTTSNTDRILVIYGATHMYLLKMLFNACPEYKLEDTMKYLK